MDYESKYNELVEVARSVVEGNPGLCNINARLGRLRDLLPEKESEDERIRKEIIECIETLIKAPGANPRLCDWLAWLEKQKDEAQKQFNLGIQAGKEEAMYEMEKEKEWSEEDELMIRCCITALSYYENNAKRDIIPAHFDIAGYLTTPEKVVDWLKSLRPQPHWKPSEEQINALEDCVNKARDIYNACNVYTSRYDAYPTLKSLLNDLKSL